MKKHTLLALLAIFLCPFHLQAAFEEKNDLLWHHAFGVYSFLPSLYLPTANILFAASGSRLFAMKECNEARGNLRYSFPFVTLGISTSFFGSDLYHENVLGLTLAKGTRTALGVRVKAMRLGIKGYPSQYLGGLDILFESHHPVVSLETCFNNAASLGYSSEREIPVSSIVTLGRIYPASWYSLNLRISFSELTGVGVEIGNGLMVSRETWLGGGYDLQTDQITSHLLLNLRQFGLSYAISSHPSLGITHTAGIVFLINRKEGMVVNEE